MAGRPSQPARGRGGCRTAALGFPDVLDTIDSAAVRHWCATALEGLRRHQHEIDELNVYPVPDGDTGTNLLLTVTAAHEAVTGDGADTLGAVLQRLSRGALLGARGNSRVIMSQLFAGLAEVLAGVPAAGGLALANALDRAATLAYRAVSAPVEGTILTVARAAADAAVSTGTDDLAVVVTRAADAARTALARTPQQLPALARAGVVDAGGRGLVVLLDALVETVTGAATQATGELPEPRRRPAVAAAREMGSDEYGYEVQFLLDAAEPAVDKLREVLAGLGDSLVVVGDGAGAIWNVHVHVNDVGATLEAAVEAGRPHRIS